MMAALNPDVRVASADLPWLTDFPHQIHHDVAGPYREIEEYLKRYPGKRETVLSTLGYYDTLAFADMVERPVLISLGQKDTTSPPKR